MIDALMLWFVIYLIPLASLMALKAPDLEVLPDLRFVGATPQAGAAVWVALALIAAHVGINALLWLGLGPQPVGVMLAWLTLYLAFAYRVGPWLH
jgi:hypothetical protein